MMDKKENTSLDSNHKHNLLKSKLAAEMTIGTIIIIILALVVLVFLIMGFSQGWGNFWDNITNLGGGSDNVQTIINSCELACTSESTYDYCGINRVVKFGSDKKDKILTCNKLSMEGVGLDKCDAVDCSFESGEGGYKV